VQTQTIIRGLFEQAGLRPNQKYGQHFLIDGNLARKLVASAQVQASDVVIEVGCGTGSLTQELASVAGKVVAVEIDRGLAAVAAAELAGRENVLLLHRDVLVGKHRIDPEVIAAAAKARLELNGRILLVANLPYQITSPLIIDLLVGPIEVSRMCFTVQKEVAGRILAAPGHRDYGPLSIIVQVLADVHRIAAIPPQAFWPMPSVDSMMMRVDLNAERRGSIRDLGHFAEMVRRCFLHRRKTLAFNLAAAYGRQTAEAILAGGISSPRARPEQVPPGTWVELSNRLPVRSETVSSRSVRRGRGRTRPPINGGLQARSNEDLRSCSDHNQQC
jgi:16S rRNA (adenine1518-N6/adenine1519-N6)-dimethyltransferase